MDRKVKTQIKGIYFLKKSHGNLIQGQDMRKKHNNNYFMLRIPLKVLQVTGVILLIIALTYFIKCKKSGRLLWCLIIFMTIIGAFLFAHLKYNSKVIVDSEPS